MVNFFKNANQRLAHCSSQLSSLSPLNILARGYAVVKNKKGEAVREPDQISVDDRVNIIGYNVDATARIESVSPSKLSKKR